MRPDRDVAVTPAAADREHGDDAPRRTANLSQCPIRQAREFPRRQTRPARGDFPERIVMNFGKLTRPHENGRARDTMGDIVSRPIFKATGTVTEGIGIFSERTGG
jgi:hypothetical protein